MRDWARAASMQRSCRRWVGAWMSAMVMCAAWRVACVGVMRVMARGGQVGVVIAFHCLCWCARGLLRCGRRKGAHSE